VAARAPLLKTFSDPDFTADGTPRARVAFEGLHTLWVNTGTLCNIECGHCYIESSPSNDRFSYLSARELEPFLAEAQAMGGREIGFTGGEPFMNPDVLAMAEAALANGFSALILTNAMRPMMRPHVQAGLVRLRERFAGALKLRISLDHYAPEPHDRERGAGSFEAALAGLRWLDQYGFALSIAGRTMWDEDETALRRGFAALFKARGLTLEAADPADLVLFPEMDETAPTPEITSACWGVLGKDPKTVMCASARMLVKRKGEPAPAVLSCTLLPYDEQFEMGATLREAARSVKLNHPHCSRFCVLGGASCSG